MEYETISSDEDYLREPEEDKCPSGTDDECQIIEVVDLEPEEENGNLSSDGGGQLVIDETNNIGMGNTISPPSSPNTVVSTHNMDWTSNQNQPGAVGVGTHNMDWTSSSNQNQSQGAELSSEQFFDPLPVPVAQGPPQMVVRDDLHEQDEFQLQDAVKYLGKVKSKFEKEPEIYNAFLEIIKELKSETIDTPDAIEKVSQLFRNHHELIVGFNAFMPPGYNKVENWTKNAEVSSLSSSIMGDMGRYGVATTYAEAPFPHNLGPHPLGELEHNHALPEPIFPFHTTTAGHHLNFIPVFDDGQMSPLDLSSGQNNVEAVSGGDVHQDIEVDVVSTCATHLQSGQNNVEAVSGGDVHPRVEVEGVSTCATHLHSSMPTLKARPFPAFNRAIEYVNKIKRRFQDQPDKYSQFLKILHNYQESKHHHAKKLPIPPGMALLTDNEIHAKVGKLFENHDDLIQEFETFLPEETNPLDTTSADKAKENVKDKVPALKRIKRQPVQIQAPKPGGKKRGPKPKGIVFQPVHDAVVVPDEDSDGQIGPLPTHTNMSISPAEAARYGTLNDYAFFDKVRRSMKSQSGFESFLKCLSLYNQEIFDEEELCLVTKPFLSKFPELSRSFKVFVSKKAKVSAESVEGLDVAPIPVVEVEQILPFTEHPIREIDPDCCKREGANYYTLPKNHMPEKCSGRTPLCHSVLNDFILAVADGAIEGKYKTPKTTHYEDVLHQSETERFELDVLIETTTATITMLECVMKSMSRMSADELEKFCLDECLGGNSAVLHKKAVRTIYGEKSNLMIEGLMKRPVVAVPLVLKRLKIKEEEWRDARNKFTPIWREKLEQSYMKSLNRQRNPSKASSGFKKQRSNSLVNGTASLQDETSMEH